jgi:Exonuclease VII small subunit
MNDMTFEQALKRVEEITELLSTSAVTVEESVTLYKEASELLTVCSDKIANAKLKVDRITVEHDDE